MTSLYSYMFNNCFKIMTFDISFIIAGCHFIHIIRTMNFSALD